MTILEWHRLFKFPEPFGRGKGNVLGPKFYNLHGDILSVPSILESDTLAPV